MKENYRIDKIFEFVYNAFNDIVEQEGIGIIYGDRPTFTQQRDEFITIDFPYRRNDHDAYGITYCAIRIYVKDNSFGLNIPRMAHIEELIMNKFPISNDRFLMHSPTITNVGGDGKGFHETYINCKILIK